MNGSTLSFVGYSINHGDETITIWADQTKMRPDLKTVEVTITKQLSWLQSVKQKVWEATRA